MKKTTKKIAQSKRQCSVNLDEDSFGQVQPKELLNLSKDLRLKPIFSDNDTISVIIKRLKKD